MNPVPNPPAKGMAAFLTVVSRSNWDGEVYSSIGCNFSTSRKMHHAVALARVGISLGSHESTTGRCHFHLALRRKADRSVPESRSQRVCPRFQFSRRFTLVELSSSTVPRRVEHLRPRSILLVHLCRLPELAEFVGDIRVERVGVVLRQLVLPDQLNDIV